MRVFLSTLLQALLGLVVLALAWTVVAAILNDPLRLPRLGVSLERALELVRSDAYHEHVAASMGVILKGLIPTILGGILLGIVAGLAPVSRWISAPVLVTLGNAPLIALMTMLLVWMGLGPSLTMAAVVVLTLFPVANAVMIAMRAPHQSLGARMPRAIVSGLRWGVVIGSSALLVSEMLAARTGIGTFIMTAGQRLDVLSVAAGTLIGVLPPMAIAFILQAIEEEIAR